MAITGIGTPDGYFPDETSYLASLNEPNLAVPINTGTGETELPSPDPQRTRRDFYDTLRDMNDLPRSPLRGSPYDTRPVDYDKVGEGTSTRRMASNDTEKPTDALISQAGTPVAPQKPFRQGMEVPPEILANRQWLEDKAMELKKKINISDEDWERMSWSEKAAHLIAPYVGMGFLSRNVPQGAPAPTMDPEQPIIPGGFQRLKEPKGSPVPEMKPSAANDNIPATRFKPNPDAWRTDPGLMIPESFIKNASRKEFMEAIKIRNDILTGRLNETFARGDTASEFVKGVKSSEEALKRRSEFKVIENKERIPEPGSRQAPWGFSFEQVDKMSPKQYKNLMENVITSPRYRQWIEDFHAGKHGEDTFPMLEPMRRKDMPPKLLTEKDLDKMLETARKKANIGPGRGVLNDNKSEVLKMVEEGATTTKIAEKFGINPWAVNTWLKRHKVTYKPITDAYTTEEITKIKEFYEKRTVKGDYPDIEGRSEQSIRSKAYKLGLEAGGKGRPSVFQDPKAVDELKQMLTDKIPRKDIGDKFGVDPSVINVWAKKLGFSKARGPYNWKNWKPRKPSKQD